MTSSTCDLEFAGMFTHCLAVDFLYIVIFARRPKETFADQTQCHKADRVRLALGLGGRRNMIDEKQVQVEGMNRNVA